MSENVIEAIQSECDRVRVLIGHYKELGPVGLFGMAVLVAAIKHGEQAIAEHDVVKMVSALHALRGCE